MNNSFLYQWFLRRLGLRSGSENRMVFYQSVPVAWEERGRSRKIVDGNIVSVQPEGLARFNLEAKGRNLYFWWRKENLTQTVCARYIVNDMTTLVTRNSSLL